MKKQPITDIKPLSGFFCRSLKLSEQIKLDRQNTEDDTLTIVRRFALCIVDEDGNPAKSLDEWDEWAGENVRFVESLIEQCAAVMGSVEQAKKK